MSDTVRPTKKQRELLNFIEQFIQEHGYSPSYREIMNGLSYTSVATVALHVNNLIKRGHLRKREHSARSLEVAIPSDDAQKVTTNAVAPSDEKWLIGKVEYFTAAAEQLGAAELTERHIQELLILTDALRILGIEGAAQSYMPRIAALRGRLTV